MERARCVAVAFLAVALFGCQAGRVPQSAVKATPPDGYAMGATSGGDIRAHVGDSTSVGHDTINDCDVHTYRAAGGEARGESYCGDKRDTSAGLWFIENDGALCGEWENPDWKSSCVNWAHQGGGFFTWEKKSGDSEQTEGDFQEYEGNPFDL